MNISNLTKALQVKLAAATTPTDLISITKALQKLQLGAVDAVSTYADMLLLTRQAGDLVFVDGEQKLYFARSRGVWTAMLDASNGAWGWGRNSSGALGDNTPTSRLSPVSVIGGFTDWVQVSAGSYRTAGVRANGTAWGWGGNINGQLGDGSATDRASPVSVVGGFTDWVQISAGTDHVVGLRSNGTVWAWGRGDMFNILGDGTQTNRSSPVSVVGGFTDWVQVSTGAFFAVGLRSNGTAWGWGRNNSGQLGDGTVADRSSPVSVVGGFADWVQVSASSGQHTVGLRSNGTVWAWGNNTTGHLGDGTTYARSSPVSVVGGFTDWVQVDAGSSHTIGLRSNGTVWAWGYNGNGQLGDNTTTSKRSPVSVVGGFTNWVQVDAGANHSIGIRANGTAWAWGNNGQGRLGDNTTATRSSPVSVVGGFTDWVQVSGGINHSIALR